MISVSQLWSFLMQWLKRDFQLHGLFTLSNIWRNFIQTTSNLAERTLWVTEEPSLLGTIFDKLIISSLKIHSWLEKWKNVIENSRSMYFGPHPYIAYFNEEDIFIGWNPYSCFVCSKNLALFHKTSFVSISSILVVHVIYNKIWKTFMTLVQTCRSGEILFDAGVEQGSPLSPTQFDLMNLIHLDMIEGNFCSC